MLAEKKRAVNIGIGLGLGLEVVGFAMVASGSQSLSMLAVPIMLVAAVLFAFGCWSYAVGKGYPGVLGLIGVFFGLIGLVILLVLPDKYKDGGKVVMPALAYAPAPGQSYGPTPQYAGYQGLETAPVYGAVPPTPAYPYPGQTENPAFVQEAPAPGSAGPYYSGPAPEYAPPTDSRPPSPPVVNHWSVRPPA